jgi:hypothetical protein
MGPEPERRTAWDVILDDDSPLDGMPEWVKVGQEVVTINGDLQGTITAIKAHVKSGVFSLKKATTRSRRFRRKTSSTPICCPKHDDALAHHLHEKFIGPQPS